jgi:uncharacterized membrane protein YbaN (DUF454 family)
MMRPLLLVAGTLVLLLGIIGIVVPGLPTTPFVLAAMLVDAARVTAEELLAHSYVHFRLNNGPLYSFNM